jgi:DNA-binding LacI/PurR family transcriptional regulator
MKPLVRQNLAQQTADHVKQVIESGLWVDRLPGVVELALHFKVSKHTVRGALGILEADGVLESGGRQQPRRILDCGTEKPLKKLRIGVLPATPVHEDCAHFQGLLADIQSDIERSGHFSVVMPQTLAKLKYDPRKVLSYLDSHPMDAWIVAGPTRNVLEALSSQSLPVYSIGGNFAGLPIAGSRTTLDAVFQEVVDLLVRGGHRRIAVVSPSHWRNPAPGPPAKAFLQALASHGIAVGKYNLPDWEESPEGLEIMLNSLFRNTPPTALFVVEPAHISGVLSFLARRRLGIPEDISVLAALLDPAQEWYRPRLSSLEWRGQYHSRNIHRWLEKVAREGSCHDQALFSASLKPGETLAPVSAKPAAG